MKKEDLDKALELAAKTGAGTIAKTDAKAPTKEGTPDKDLKEALEIAKRTGATMEATQAAAIMRKELEENAEAIAARKMRAALRKEYKTRAPKRVNCDIPGDVVDALDKLANELGCSRNALIIRACEWLVTK